MNTATIDMPCWWTISMNVCLLCTFANIVNVLNVVKQCQLELHRQKSVALTKTKTHPTERWKGVGSCLFTLFRSLWTLLWEKNSLFIRQTNWCTFTMHKDVCMNSFSHLLVNQIQTEETRRGFSLWAEIMAKMEDARHVRPNNVSSQFQTRLCWGSLVELRVIL